MHHLTLEELARLVDEAPGMEERAHLEACSRCAEELAALAHQTSLLAQLPDPDPPAALRARVEAAVGADLIVGRPRLRLDPVWLRAAATVTIFLLGTAAGTFLIAPRLHGAGSGAGVAGEYLAGEPSGVEQATVALAAAEAAYLRALTDYAQLSFTADGLDPLNRLAALEGIVLTTRAALREAPADPVINNYHLTALGQRDALLRQLQAATDATDEWF